MLLGLIAYGCGSICAQAPRISYQSPQVYTISTPISPLAPTNTGGAVPKTPYGGVTTLAGIRNAGFADGAGTTAQFNAPRGLSCDNQGNIYLADRSNNRIRKITPAGLVSTVAGSGISGRDNLIGTAATFTGPNGLVAARDGTIYVADSGNHLIRKITTNGVVSTYAGNKMPGNADGKQYASFDFPNDVVIDNAGKLYVSDYANEEIRTVGTDGVVHTVAGMPDIGNQDGTGPVARFYNPGGLAIDGSGNIIICDVNNNTIRKMTPDSVVTTLAGNGTKSFADGPAASAMFNYPAAAAIDALGNLYIADIFNYLIRKIDPSGNVTTLCGKQGIAGFTNGQRESATFGQTFGVTTDNKGNLYVSDGGNNSIRQVSLTGYEIDKPLPPGLSFDETTGTISGTPTAASPSTDYTITAYNLQGSSSTVVNITVNNIAPPTAPNISYQTPQTYTVATTISPLAPTNTGGAIPAQTYGKVTTFAGSGAPGQRDGTGTGATFNHPIRMGFDATTKTLYVADRDNNLIRKVTTPQAIVTTYATGFSQPNGITAEAGGKLFVADAASNSVKLVEPDGTVSVFAGNGSQSYQDGTGVSASFHYPYDIVMNSFGNLYVADSYNNAIREITPQAVVSTFAGNGSAGYANGIGNQALFNQPNSIAIDQSGNLYVGDTYNNRIRMITPARVVTTIAGTGAAGYQDGPIASATFNFPGGTAVDYGKNLFVADVGNYAIRRIDANGTVSTLAGSGAAGDADGIGKAAMFGRTYGTALDVENGLLYVTDLDHNKIKVIEVTGYTINKPLPPGLVFDPTTGIISGTPTAASPATDYTVTAYNLAGSSSTIVNIRVISGISLAALPDKTVCSTDFAPVITGGTGSYTITSSNNNVATVTNGQIHIVGPGTTTITATDGFSTKSQTLTVAAPVVPTITVNPTVTSGCDGMLYTFTAVVTGAGTAPVYQWKVNGQPAGTNSDSFSSSSLKNGDIITCTLTNTTDCTTGPVPSDKATVISQPYVTPSVSIVSSATGPVAPGTTIVFTAIPTNGGTNPIYQWQVNNNIVGTNNPVFSSACLNNGDLVTCNMTNQGGACLTTLFATSNITVSLLPGSAISITSSATTISQGQLVIFTATVAGSGNSHAFQWQVNGADVGANSPTFTTATLKNGDVVTCVLTDSNCSPPVSSNAITMTVLLSPNVIIPNAFTPNDDGINDKWNIEALASYPNCIVDVFTRYGSLIFHSKGYSQPWDGTLKGGKLPPGTYYYVIDLGNNSPKLSGYVALIR